MTIPKLIADFFAPGADRDRSAMMRGRPILPPSCLAMLSALLAALAAYHLLVILGHGNPDAVCEGLVSYTGSDWALACGRWAIRYMNLVSANLIMPGIWVALYALCCGASAILLSKLWHIESRAALCLIACLLTVNPTVIEQSLLQYMFMAWGISNLLGVLFVYLCCREGSRPLHLLLAALCMSVAFGLYQACVGLICVCFCMTLLLRLLSGASLRELWLVPRFAVAALLGTLLYFVILRVETLRYAVEESERVEVFSLSGALRSLPTSFPGAYKTYFSYFADARLNRALFYSLLFCVGALWILAALIRLLRARKLIAFGVSVLLLALIPAFSNLADILFPYNEPVLIMQYQSMLVIPFLFALPNPAGLDGSKAAGLVKKACAILALLVFWTYLVSANATYRAYDLSYRYTYFAVSSALEEVYRLPDYSPDEVIAFAGFPDDSLLRESFPVYDYAYGMYDNLTFWDGMMGLQLCRRNYLLNYFGLDGGYVFGQLYNEAVASDEFREMPLWPSEGSVRRLNHLIIVKYAEDPPLFT